MLLYLYFLISSLIIYPFIIFIHFIRTRHLKTHKFSFSERNYYLLISVFILGITLYSITIKSIQPIIMFTLFGIIGVIGETLFSMWWHTFFGKRFWVYQADTLVHSYTSTLNFIPYGVGGFLYIHIVTSIIDQDKILQIFQSSRIYYDISIVFLLTVFLQIILFYLFVRKHLFENKFHQVTTLNYFFFFFPLLQLVIYFILIHGTGFLLLTLLFGIIATSAEYLFGKVTQLIISKKLWIYSYNTFDQGHFTPLSIPAFILGGYYFLIIGELINIYLLH